MSLFSPLSNEQLLEEIDGLRIILTRKRMRNLRMRLKTVDDELQVHVSAPNSTAATKINEFIVQNRAWIEKSAKKRRERPTENLISREELLKNAEALTDYWAERMGVEYSRLRLREMKTRWGVCNTETRVITYNSELAKYPAECLEYVVVHELNHIYTSTSTPPNSPLGSPSNFGRTREKPHSKRFWANLEKFLPEYRAALRILRGQH